MEKYYPFILENLMKLGKLTYRIKEYNKLEAEAAIKNGGLLLGWHCHLWSIAVALAEHGYTALASQSREGEFISQTLEKLGWQVVRGSSSAGAVSSLKKMLKLVSKQRQLVLTPDGPRGPARKIKLGAVMIQQRSGSPVIPIGVANGWKHTFKKSWDNFELPFLFSKIIIYYGEPIQDLEGLEREEAARIIEAGLEKANIAAQKRL
ncbi:MAG: lysophospholipid acyltransferase family protein [Bacillota bacterium]